MDRLLLPADKVLDNFVAHQPTANFAAQLTCLFVSVALVTQETVHMRMSNQGHVQRNKHCVHSTATGLYSFRSAYSSHLADIKAQLLDMTYEDVWR